MPSAFSQKEHVILGELDKIEETVCEQDIFIFFIAQLSALSSEPYHVFQADCQCLPEASFPHLSPHQENLPAQAWLTQELGQDHRHCSRSELPARCLDLSQWFFVFFEPRVGVVIAAILMNKCRLKLQHILIVTLCQKPKSKRACLGNC